MTTIVTTLVGIRELKRDAAKLVRRAASGECVVVTRYGKPTAQLVPVTGGAGREPTPRMQAWERERAAFARIERRLRRSHHGRWVGIRAGRVVAVSDDSETLSRRLFRRFRGEAFFVGRVGTPPQLLDFPGFELG